MAKHKIIIINYKTNLKPRINDIKMYPILAYPDTLFFPLIGYLLLCPLSLHKKNVSVS